MAAQIVRKLVGGIWRTVEADENGGGGSQPVLAYADFLFTEEAAARVYTETLPIPAGATIDDVRLYALGGEWQADTALLDVGDSINPVGYYGAFDLTTRGAGAWGAGGSYTGPQVAADNAPDTLHQQFENVAAAPVQYRFSTVDDYLYGAQGLAGVPNAGPDALAWLGVGVRYANADTLTITVTTTAAAPVTPGATLLVKVLYWTPAGGGGGGGGGGSQTLAQTLTLGNDAGGRTIESLADPIGLQDADTKAARNAAIVAAGGFVPFDPSQISGLALWLDASQIVGLSDGDPVASWADLSTNGLHATQASGANKPIYKTAIRNGLPVVRFGLSPQQWLDVLDGLDLFRSKPGAGFAVACSDPYNYWDPFYISANVDHAAARFGMNDGNAFADPNDQGGGNQVGDSFTTTAGGWGSCVVWVSVPDAATGVQTCGGSFYNGAGALTESATAPYNVGDLFTAAADSANSDSALVQVNRHDGTNYGGARDIGEIIYYDRALTPTERRKLLEYLADKWATVV